MQRTHRGFTLIELLVVIGIICILVAILIPVVGKSRDNARTAQCMSNQRQIFTAIKAFAGDNADLAPGTAGGFPITGPASASAGLAAGATGSVTVGQAIGANEQYPQAPLEQATRSALIVRGYLASSAVFHCPSRDANPYLPDTAGVGTPLVIFHYVFNQYLVGDMPCDSKTFLPKWSGDETGNPYVQTGGANNFQKKFSRRVPITLTRAKNGSECVMITEDVTVDGSNITDSDKEYTPPKKADGSQPPDRIYCSPVHNKRPSKHDDKFANTVFDNVNCTFLDGHAETIFVDTTGGPLDTGDPNHQFFSVPSDTTGLKDPR